MRFHDFPWERYLLVNPDLVAAGIKTKIAAWQHWKKHGQKEGRKFLEKTQNMSRNLLRISNIYDNNYEKLRGIYLKIHAKNLGDPEPKKEFRYICFRYLNYIRSIKIDLTKNSYDKNEFEAVLIEFRNLPHIEFLLRNAILKLGTNWSHTLVCGNMNFALCSEIVKGISNKIRIVKLDYDDLTKNEYSKLLTSSAFWNELRGNKILIYQEDSFIFNRSIAKFTHFDYIGAPWLASQNDNHCGVGNGGFSLRTKDVMLKIIKEKAPDTTTINSSTLKYMNNCNLNFIPEDVYFTKNMEDLKIGSLADRGSAAAFSTERILHNSSLGGHNFWLSDPNWKQRILNSTIIQFDRQYRSQKDFEHRGGWNYVLDNLEQNDFYSDQTPYVFLDMIEKYFLFPGKVARVYDMKWSGIVHLTPSAPSYRMINLSHMFDNPYFIKSLPYCVFIVTLSNYVTSYLQQRFEKMGLRIGVYTIKHPVQSDRIPLFDPQKYLTNKNKLLIQLGQQCRKVTSIYRLKLLENHKKLWLTGIKDIKACLEMRDNEIDYLHLNRASLDLDQVVVRYTNTWEEYDWLLSSNIVFIDLFDASANNSVLECIVRNTPLIITKIPSVVEYLGSSYPLYFTKLEEVPDLLSYDKITQAHEYLMKMDKSDLTINHFMKELYTLVNRHYV